MAGRIRIPPYKPLGINAQGVPGGGYFDIDASAGQFGASPLLQLGLQAVQGAIGIAGAVSPYLGSDNEAAVKAADTKLGETEQALLFDPQTGYLNLQGQAALQQAPAVLDAYTEAQARTLDIAAEVYVLKHRHELPDGFRDDKFIGLYSSAAGAQAAIERTRKLPGFRDAPDGFSVRKIRIDEDLFSNPA